MKLKLLDLTSWFPLSSTIPTQQLTFFLAYEKEKENKTKILVNCKGIIAITYYGRSNYKDHGWTLKKEVHIRTPFKYSLNYLFKYFQINKSFDRLTNHKGF